MRYNVAASLDGYIADASGGSDWIPQDTAVDFEAIFVRVDTVLLGRRSFELVRRRAAAPWRSNMRVYVFSHTLRSEAYPGVTVVGANAPEVVAVTMASTRLDRWRWQK